MSEMPESEFAALERRVSRQAEQLLDGFTMELSRLETETLEAIADYREQICPGGWMQRCIREYVDVWR